MDETRNSERTFSRLKAMRAITTRGMRSLFMVVLPCEIHGAPPLHLVHVLPGNIRGFLANNREDPHAEQVIVFT